MFKRKLAAAILLSLVSCSAHSQNAREQANNAAIADGVTKAVSRAVRATDLNPAGPILSLGLTAAVFQYADTLPETRRPAAYAFAASVWQGAAANNVCMTAAFLTGGSFTPVCIASGSRGPSSPGTTASTSGASGNAARSCAISPASRTSRASMRRRRRKT